MYIYIYIKHLALCTGGYGLLVGLPTRLLNLHCLHATPSKKPSESNVLSGPCDMAKCEHVFGFTPKVEGALCSTKKCAVHSSSI